MNYKLSQKIGAIAVSMAMVIGVTAALPADNASASVGDEYVSDGGFEALSVGTALPTGKFTVANASAEVVNDVKATGSNSVKVVPKSASSRTSTVTYTFEIGEGVNYKASAKVYVGDAIDGAANVGDEVYIYCPAVGTKTTKSITEFKDGFAEISVSGVTPKAYTNARLVISGPNGYSWYVDDISCVEAEKPTPTPSPTPSPTPTPAPTPTPEPTPEPTASPSEEPSDSMIIGGGFENMPVGSSVSSRDTLGEFSVASASNVITDEVKNIDGASGEKALKVIPNLENKERYPGVNYLISLTGGVTYYISAKVYVGEEIPGAAEVGGELYIRFTDLGGTINTDAYNARGSAAMGDLQSGFCEIHSKFTMPKDYPQARINICGPNGYNWYVDDVSCEVAEENTKIAKTEYSEILGMRDNMAVVGTDLTATMHFTSPLKTSSVNFENVELNGETGKVTAEIKDDKTIELKINNLQYGQNYKLTLGSDTWENKYSNKLEDLSVEFMTTNKVYVGSAGLFDGTAEITDKKITSGNISLRADRLKNMTSEKQEVTAFMLLYKDGKKINTSCSRIEIDANGEIESVITSIPLALDDGSYEIKAFIWDSIGSAVSLADSITWRNK